MPDITANDHDSAGARRGLRARGARRASASRSPAAETLLDPLELIAPEAVPDATVLAARLTPALRETCRAALATLARPAAALAALTRALPKEPPAPWQDVAFLIATGQSADEATHDRFFRVRRSGHRDPLGFLRGQFAGLDALACDLAETPTRLDAQALAELGGGLRAAVAFALDLAAPAQDFPALSAPADPPADFAQRRWLRGHHIFAALTQALLFAAHALEAAADPGALRAAAELWRALLAASGRALEFTADFPADIYRDHLRGAMQEPNQPKGFSGLLSSDHRYLVMRMRGMTPVFQKLKSEAPESHSAVTAALSQVYDSHKQVCARFVGVDRASLLMASDCGRSAVEQIDRFKTMRLRPLQ